jgi:hypothetical protein
MWNEESKAGCYDLSGRKITDQSQMKPGLYIINGKKVVMKK